MTRATPTIGTGSTALALLLPTVPGEPRRLHPSCPATSRLPDAGHVRRGPAPSRPSPPPPARPPRPSCAPRARSPPRTPPSRVPTATRRPPRRSLPGRRPHWLASRSCLLHLTCMAFLTDFTPATPRATSIAL